MKLSTPICRLLLAAALVAGVSTHNGPTMAQQAAPTEDPDAPAAGAEPAPPTDSIERLIPEQRDAARSESEEERLDRLFERLAEAEDKARADRIAGNIRQIMMRSGSPTIDLLMVRASAAMRERRLGTALDVLDAVVRLAPTYAEGWNMRATVYFMREDFGRSVADIERVLAIEPRHWGAITGLAMILVAVDQDEAALDAMNQALSVHPFLEDLSERREKLRTELEGDAT